MMGPYVESMLLGHNGWLQNRNQILQHVIQAEFFFCNSKIAAFDSRHIQNFIDQAQQQFGGESYFPEAVLYPVPVVDMCSGNGCHANDGVHRSTDVMTHT